MEIVDTVRIKKNLHRFIEETDDLEILTEVKRFFMNKNKTSDWWEVISDEERHEIELGIKQLDNEEKIEYEHVKLKADKLLGRL